MFAWVPAFAGMTASSAIGLGEPRMEYCPTRRVMLI
jgi:hypothetical protein